MSFSISVKARKAPAIFSAVDETQPTHELSEESLAILRGAKKAAKDLIEAQVVGGSDAAFSVSISGHAAEGLGAGSSVSVSVYHATEEAKD